MNHTALSVARRAVVLVIASGAFGAASPAPAPGSNATPAPVAAPSAAVAPVPDATPAAAPVAVPAPVPVPVAVPATTAVPAAEAQLDKKPVRSAESLSNDAALIFALPTGTMRPSAIHTPAPVQVSTNVLKTYPQAFDPPYALLRGTVNFATCWLEVPRCLVLENGRHPVLGVGSGSLEAALFVSARVILSVGDYMFLGFTGPNGYNPVWLPEYVFQAQWTPFCEDAALTNAVEVYKQVTR